MKINGKGWSAEIDGDDSELLPLMEGIVWAGGPYGMIDCDRICDPSDMLPEGGVWVQVMIWAEPAFSGVYWWESKERALNELHSALLRVRDDRDQKIEHLKSKVALLDQRIAHPWKSLWNDLATWIKS